MHGEIGIGARVQLSRRQFLQAASVSVGALALSACATPGAAPGSEEGAPAQAANITLLTSGWPVTPMPAQDVIDANPVSAGYAVALERWMEANPGVEIEQIEVNIWDQQAVTAAVAGGTAPAFIYGRTLGGGGIDGAQAAFQQGLMADVSFQSEELGLRDKLTPGARQVFENEAVVGDAVWYYPIDSGFNGGIWYRKDLLAAAGMAEPTIDWTMQDFIQIAAALAAPGENRYGFGGSFRIAGWFLNSWGFDLLTRVPTPETSWNWSRDFSDPQWATHANALRDLIFTQSAIFSDVSLEAGGDYRNLWGDGSVAMISDNILGAFGPAATERSPAALAEQLGIEYDELIGFAPRPRGDGFIENGLYLGGVSFSPDLAGEALNIAVNLVDYMFLGEGWDTQKVAQYEAGRDLKAVFNYPFPIDGRREYAGVPGTFADAWGQSTLDRLNEMAGLPQQPANYLYFPTEENTGPDNQAIDDLWSTLVYVSDVADVGAQFEQTEQTWNQQAAGFSSSVDDENFIASAQEYYAALNDFWQNASPEFHDTHFRPFYETVVQPNLNQ